MQREEKDGRQEPGGGEFEQRRGGADDNKEREQARVQQESDDDETVTEGREGDATCANQIVLSLISNSRKRKEKGVKQQ